MLPKVVGYQGFQSYGELPYPSLKAGKSKLSPNDVWEKTVRENDKQSYYENFHYSKSNYKKTQVENTQPQNYKDHQHVKQGFQHSIRNTGANTLKKYDPLDETSNLNSGVEHWKTNYSQSIVDPYKINKATRPSWTLHKEPHTVNAQLMKSEYKNQLGELGTKPIDKWDHNGNLKSTKLDDDLKMGTTQSTYHVPGYTGFIPSANTIGQPLQQAQAKQPRQVFSKISVVENYHTKIPGYAGHQPKNPINQRGQLRDNCFSSFNS